METEVDYGISYKGQRRKKNENQEDEEEEEESGWRIVGVDGRENVRYFLGTLKLWGKEWELQKSWASEMGSQMRLGQESKTHY